MNYVTSVFETPAAILLLWLLLFCNLNIYLLLWTPHFSFAYFIVTRSVFSCWMGSSSSFRTIHCMKCEVWSIGHCFWVISIFIIIRNILYFENDFCFSSNDYASGPVILLFHFVCSISYSKSALCLPQCFFSSNTCLNLK